MAGPWEQFQAQPDAPHPADKFAAPEIHPADKFADRLGPWNTFAQPQQAAPQQDKPGPYQQFFSMLGTPEGRSKAFSAVKQAVPAARLPTEGMAGVVKGTVDQATGLVKNFVDSTTAPTSISDVDVAKGLTPEMKRSEQEVGPAFDVAGITELSKRPAVSLQKFEPVEGGAGLAQKLLSPASVSPDAGRGAAGWRKATGEAARETETTRAALDQHERAINTLPPDQQLGLLGYMEGRSTGAKIAEPKLQEFADSFRGEMNKRRDKIEATEDLQKAGMIDDYVRHYWKDPQAAAKFTADWTAKQGNSRSLKKRSIPTIAEGIEAGLVPATTNPLHIAMRYVSDMDRFLGMKEMLSAGETAGDVSYHTPGKAPAGLVKLDGYLAQRGDQKVAHAPEGWAKIYNNQVHPGISGDWKDAYTAFRQASNMTTQTVLGLSGYHGLAMAKAGIHSEMSRGVGQVVGGAKTAVKGAVKGDVGQMLSGAKMLGKGAAAQATAFAAPVSRAMTGRKLQQVYLGRTPGSPDFRKLANLYAEAGGRAVGKGHALDYDFSRAGSYFSSWRRGALKMEMRGALQDIKDAQRPVNKTAKLAVEFVGRAFDTLTDPLFKKYIPLMKNGLWADTMSAWLEANPNATHEEQVRVASRIVDSIDNRLGEMINDNLMWKTTQKQVAAIGMLSYSWNVGKVREFMGGAQAALRTMGKGADIASPDFDPRVAYVIAIPMAVATTNAIYQYMKTGQPPQSAQDLMSPRTGGQVPGPGGHGSIPERTLLPGDEKEIFGWYNMFGGNEPVSQELYNKANPLIRMGVDFMRKKDWRDDPFIRPDPTIPEWLNDFMTHAIGSLEPISGERMFQGEKIGSKMGLPEEALGIRQTPQYLGDPEGYTKMMKGIRERAWLGKERHDKSQQRQYGGTQE